MAKSGNALALAYAFNLSRVNSLSVVYRTKASPLLWSGLVVAA